VTVTDVDDEVARFEHSWYRFDVTENQPGGTVVGHVSGVDHDLEPFNSFHFQLDTTSSEDSQSDSGDISSLDGCAMLSTSVKYLDEIVLHTVQVKRLNVRTFIYGRPPLTGKPEEQLFTMRNGVLTSVSSRQDSAISSRRVGG